jgi:hypothetical protein
MAPSGDSGTSSGRECGEEWLKEEEGSGWLGRVVELVRLVLSWCGRPGAKGKGKQVGQTNRICERGATSVDCSSEFHRVRRCSELGQDDVSKYGSVGLCRSTPPKHWRTGGRQRGASRARGRQPGSAALLVSVFVPPSQSVIALSSARPWALSTPLCPARRGNATALTLGSATTCSMVTNQSGTLLLAVGVAVFSLWPITMDLRRFVEVAIPTRGLNMRWRMIVNQRVQFLFRLTKSYAVRLTDALR